MRYEVVLVVCSVLAVASACDRSEELPPDLEGVEVERIDATSEDAWVYMDLDDPAAADQQAGWDLRFRRQRVLVNGGAGASVAIVDGKGITEVAEPPDGEYLTDSGEEETDQAFSRRGDDHWYDYDISVHKLSPKERTYVVESDQGAFYKLQFTGYYDDEGESGYPTFYWDAFE
jgi:hypothetical protein